jgi:hypothetical protein
VRIIPDKTIGWTVSFADNGTGSATLHYQEKIDSTTKVELVDTENTLYFTGFVTIVTRTEVGTGYQMELVDPLSGGFMSEVSFTGAPTGFPATGTQEEINDWCAAHDVEYYYTGNGTYAVEASGSESIADDVIGQRVVREGITRGGYYNRIVVTGSAEKEVPAEEETVSISEGGVSVTETFQGDRMISRATDDGESTSDETWDWDDGTNVCMEYTNTETYPSKFGVGSGIDYKNRLETRRTVESVNADISAYRILQEVKRYEYGAKITGPSTWEPSEFLARTEDTEIIRNTDGSGTKTVVIEEIARNEYEPAVDFYEMLPLSKEKTIYRRKRGRPYSFTQTWGRRSTLNNDTGDLVFSLEPTEASYGAEEPEQPEMEEAINILSAEVEYIEEFDQDVGTYERTESLPEEPVPDSIETEEALYNWLYERARNLAQSKKRQSILIDEQSLRLTLTASFKLGQSVNGFKTTSIQHTFNVNAAQTTITGTRPSSQSVPLRGQINAAAMLVGTMRKLDRNQDNVRGGEILKPISSHRALANVNGKTYKVDNPVGGYLYAGDSVPMYRATGGTTLGRMN